MVRRDRGLRRRRLFVVVDDRRWICSRAETFAAERVHRERRKWANQPRFDHDEDRLPELDQNAHRSSDSSNDEYSAGTGTERRPFRFRLKRLEPGSVFSDLAAKCVPSA
jgi:hypothetical protein